MLTVIKKLLFVCFLFVSCENKHDKLLKQLDAEQNKELGINTRYAEILDSMLNYPSLKTDKNFLSRAGNIELDLKLQKDVVSGIKEKILLEK